MEEKILITAGDVEVEAEVFLNETGKAIFESLPIVGTVNRWGEEVYFSIPVRVDESEDARDVLDDGELGYWPTGKAFCIFFGKTPSSRGDEIRAASNVNVFGKVLGSAKVFTDVEEGTEIRVTRSKGAKTS